MASKAQIEATARYDQKNVKGVYIKLNRQTDADIIKHLENVQNVQGYIKQLIRSDINK